MPETRYQTSVYTPTLYTVCCSCHLLYANPNVIMNKAKKEPHVPPKPKGTLAIRRKLYHQALLGKHVPTRTHKTSGRPAVLKNRCPSLGDDAGCIYTHQNDLEQCDCKHIMAWSSSFLGMYVNSVRSGICYSSPITARTMYTFQRYYNASSKRLKQCRAKPHLAKLE